MDLSLESGQLPFSLKTAVLSPLLKKPSLDHGLLGNYRPISNLKVIPKIIEKVVAVSPKTTFTALTRVHSDILVEIDNRHYVILFLLDLSAAFESLDHNILLKRLDSRFSICGTALDLFRSFLKPHTICLNRWKKSQPCELKCGVSQGCVFGPILYLLYTAPLADVPRHRKMHFHFFAADTQLYISLSPNNDLQLASTIAKISDCLSDLDRWMSLNKLKLNKDKTELFLPLL